MQRYLATRKEESGMDVGKKEEGQLRRENVSLGISIKEGFEGVRWNEKWGWKEITKQKERTNKRWGERVSGNYMEINKYFKRMWMKLESKGYENQYSRRAKRELLAERWVVEEGWRWYECEKGRKSG